MKVVRAARMCPQGFARGRRAVPMPGDKEMVAKRKNDLEHAQAAKRRTEQGSADRTRDEA
jgi:hypothetical protein